MPYVGRPYRRVLAQGTSPEAQRQHKPEQTDEHYRRASAGLPLTGGHLCMHGQRDNYPGPSQPEQTPERATEDLRPLSLPFQTYQNNQIRHTNSTNSEGEMYTP